MQSHRHIIPGIFKTESGGQLRDLELFYCTSGNYVPGKSKVVWVCHALTASADCEDWWPDLIGKDKSINPDDHFIICVNLPSSCYGSTGPLSVDPNTGNKYYGDFPFFTIRDFVKAFVELRKHLGIEQIHLLMGGSMGGYQCLEWAIEEPGVIANMMLIATSPKESAWGIAVHTAQRMAIEADPTFGQKRDDAGENGLRAARAIGMLTYRNYEAFVKTQSDAESRIIDFRAESYIRYQGEKLVRRFNAYSYVLLGRSMDSHDISRGRSSVEQVLASVRTNTLCIGISSDILCPPSEQRFMAEHIPGARFVLIDSPYGHDGFLVEGKKVGEEILRWLK